MAAPTMSTIVAPQDETAKEQEEEEDDTLLSASRSYQLEMFEESLRRNIIVAMDTGTGKTRIAILRMRAELERSPPPKIVWFLAPTVFLCYQQFYAISSQIPGAQGKILTGDSSVDAWSTQAVWDAALLNVRFVVATPQVLLDALIHGFVSIASIPLLVFDEAHGCVKLNAGRRIMGEFYHAAVDMGLPHPAILGLTASPVQGKKLDGLEELERTLDALCITPTRHRDDLIAHTKRPSTFRHLCSSVDDVSATAAYGSNLARLLGIMRSQNAQPPVDIRQVKTQYGRSVTEGHVRWTWKFLEAFCRKAATISHQLGPWASEYYVHKVIRRCVEAARRRPSGENEPYLMALLQQAAAARPTWPDKAENHAVFCSGLSSRVQKLVEILADHRAERPTGIVFVKERPMAAVLARLISLHPRTRSRFQAGHVVGMSKIQKDSGFDGLLLLAPKDGRVPLLLFRTRKLNLLVATSVVEEGIDIPACNLVVCIDELTNLKGFIQRRGRARDDNSEFHLLVGVQGAFAQEWERLEAEMKRRYEDELREAQHLQDIEATSALDDGLLQPLYVAATGARLPARDAKKHLSHFCATLSSAAFVDCRPVYMLHQDPKAKELFRATVQLPIILPAHLLRAQSAHAWLSQSDAYADAAFQAYKAIYEAGLLSDNLLPPKPSDDILARSVESRPGVVAVSEKYRPWPAIHQTWKLILASPPGADAFVYRHTVRIVDDLGGELFEADLILPCALPNIQSFQMFWTAHSQRPWTVHMSPARRQSYGPGQDQYHDDSDHAGFLLSAAYGHRWPMGDLHRLVRVVCAGEQFSKEQLASRAFDPQLFANLRPFTFPDMACLVRDVEGAPYFYQGFLESKPPLSLVKKAYKGFEEAPEDAAYVVVRPWPKIVGLLHRTANVELDKDGGASPAASPALDAASAKPYPRLLPVAECRVDNLPVAYVQFGAVLPPLIPVLELYLVVAELLSSTSLRELAVRDVSLVATAISAPVARLPTNYEYLEFIGDSILKVCATANCAAQNLYAPEGYLSLYKDRLVANSRLCRAALELGLDRFIVSKQWSLKKWKRYCDALGADSKTGAGDSDTRADDAGTPEEQEHLPLEMSTKMLADVVEALIGACHVDSGMPLALQCVSLFLPDVQWLSLKGCRDILYEAAPDEPPCPPPLGLEELLGYVFTKKSLLVEAMTHASVPSEQAGACMERLEFTGDAILDHILVQTLASVRPPLSHHRMHLLRSTLANAGFLAFTAMAFTIAEPSTVVSATVVSSNNNSRHSADPDPVVVSATFQKPLWSFMRHGASREMAAAQQATTARFAELKDSILEALWISHTYPWTLLLDLRADKFYSDLLEAIIGAIWVDSGSMAAVETLLETIGLLPYLRRAVEEDIHLLHPKEELGAITGNAKIRYEVTRSTRAEASRAVMGNGSDGDSKKENGKRARPGILDNDGNGTNNVEDSDDEDDEALDEETISRLAISGDGEDDIVYGCRLFFNERCEAEVNFCISREMAEASAAELALHAWKAGLLGK